MYAFKAVLAHTKCICLRHKYVRMQGCTCTYQMHMLETQICTHARLHKTCKQLTSALASVRVYSSTGKHTEATTHFSGKCLRCFEHGSSKLVLWNVPHRYKSIPSLCICMHVCLCMHVCVVRVPVYSSMDKHTEAATHLSGVCLRCFDNGGSELLLSHLSVCIRARENSQRQQPTSQASV